jgi:hypothetical protein
MKKIVIIGLISFLAIACTSGHEKAAKKFTENLFRGKVEEAKSYATQSSSYMLDMFMQAGVLPVKPDYKFEMVKDSVVSKTAWITYIDERGKHASLKVVKIDSKWHVHID